MSCYSLPMCSMYFNFTDSRRPRHFDSGWDNQRIGVAGSSGRGSARRGAVITLATVQNAHRTIRPQSVSGLPYWESSPFYSPPPRSACFQTQAAETGLAMVTCYMPDKGNTQTLTYPSRPDGYNVGDVLDGPEFACGPASWSWEPWGGSVPDSSLKITVSPTTTDSMGSCDRTDHITTKVSGACQ
jgi:hypothetical protein